MTDTVGLRLLTVTLTHYPPSAANLRQISPHATFMMPIFILFTTLPECHEYDWSTKYEFLALFKFQPIKFALTSVVGIFYYKENESRTFVSGVKCK